MDFTTPMNTVNTMRNITGVKRQRETTNVGDEGMGKMFKNLMGAFIAPSAVSRRDNHVYFRGGVTSETATELINVIDGINFEYELQVNNNNTVYVMPKPIYLHINSPGGSLACGFMLYDAIKSSNIPIYTVVEKYAISSGSLMFMAGKKRFMTPTSYVLIHQLSQTGYSHETFANMEDNMTNSKDMMSKIYNIYIREQRNASPDCVFTQEKIEEILKHDILWDAETCKKYGLYEDIYYNTRQREIIDRSEFFANLINMKTVPESNYKFNDVKYDISSDIVEGIRTHLEKKKEDTKPPGFPFPFDMMKMLDAEHTDETDDTNDTNVKSTESTESTDEDTESTEDTESDTDDVHTVRKSERLSKKK